MFFSPFRKLTQWMNPLPSRRKGRRSRATIRPRVEQLEDRTLMTINVTDVSVVEGNPTEVSGSLNPGLETDLYRFSGTTGQRLSFDNLMVSAGGATWSLLSPSNQSLEGPHGLSTDFTVTLPSDGLYVLLINSTVTSTIDYQFQVTDLTDFPLLASGFGVVQSGTIAAGQEQQFPVTASAGQAVYFDSQDNDSDPINAELRDPFGEVIYTINASFDQGPTVLPFSGTYTLTIRGSTPTSTGDYSFRLLNLPTNATPLTLGATVVNTLAAPFQTDIFRFTGSVGQRLFYDGLEGDFDSVFARLVSPSGTAVIGTINSDSDSLPVALNEPGTYYLIVDSVLASGAPDYRFRLLNLGDQPEPALDTTVMGDLTPGFEADLYRISGTAGQRLFFDSLAVSVGFGNSWTLFGPANQSLAGGGFLNSDFETTLPTDGTYILALQGNTGASPITYSFRIVTPDITTTTYTLGTTISNGLSEPGESDVYTFTGSVGQRLFFDSLGAVVSGLATLTSPSGAQVFAVGPSSDSSTPVTLVEAGTYRLTFDVSGDITGAYSFRLLDVGVQPMPALDTTVMSELTPGMEADLYRINGTAGQRLFFDNLAVSASFNGTWALFGPANQLVAGNVFLGQDFEFTLPIDGPYVLALLGIAGPIPVTYSFRIVTPDTNTIAYTLGTTVSNAISEPGENDIYTFTGSVGQRLFFDSLGAVVSGTATLTSPSGGQVFAVGPSSDSSTLVTLVEAGTYRLSFDGSGDSTGAYSFRLVDVGAQPAPALDTTVMGDLTPGLEADLYRFTGTADQRLFFDNLAVSLGVNGVWTLFGPANQAVAGGVFLLQDFEFTLPIDGPYVLALQGNAGAAPVTYSFRIVTPDTNTTAYTLGATISNVISEPGELDVYIFTGSPGQRVYFDSLGAVASGTASLRSPTGAQLFSIGLTSDTSPVTLVEAGTYQLIVDASGDGMGTYSFQLLDVAAQPAPAFATTIMGSLMPGLETELYRVNGTAGQRLLFDNLSVSSPSVAFWTLFTPANQFIIQASYETDFTANLPVDGTYILTVQGFSVPATYTFQIVDQSDAPVTPTGFGTVHSGSLATGTEMQFTYTALAGQTVYFDSQDIDSDGATALLRDATMTTIFSISASFESGRIVLPRSGTYTLILGNSSGSTADFRFRLLALPANSTPLTLGTTRTDTLPDFRTDVFHFTGTVGQRVFFDSLDSDFENVRVNLTSPGNVNIFSLVTLADNGPVTLPESGTYYLIVDGNQAATPNYSFRLLDVGAQPALAFDTSTMGDLTPGLETDLYRFTGTAGQRFYFDSIAASSSLGSWQLIDPNNSSVASNALGFDFEGTLPMDGPYLLALLGNNSTAAITYNFRVVTPDTTTTAYTLGTTISNGISEPGEMDVYTFTGSVGQRLFFDSLGSVVASFGSVVLRSPSGTVVLTTDPTTDTGPITLPEAGLYRLTYDFNGDITGAYNFRLLDVGTQPTLTFDTSVMGDLTPGLEADLYRFMGTAGQRLYFDSIAASSFSGTWALFGPNNNFLANNTLGFDFEATLSQDGPYVLTLLGANPTTAITYNFQILTPDTTTSAYVLGSTINGTINEPGEVDVYTLTGSVGQRLFFDSLGSVESIFGTVVLRSPSGTVLFTTDPTTDAGPVTLSEAGLYRLTYDFSGDRTGAYSFRLLSVASQPTLTFDTSVMGDLTPGLEADLYRFTGTAGQRLYFDAITTSSFSGNWSLFGPGNQQVTGTTIGVDFEVTLPQDGPYVLALQGANTTTPLTYNFRVVTPDTTSVTYFLGTTISSSISEPAEIDVYTFEGAVGQRLYFDSRLVLAFGSSLILRSPSGVQIFGIDASVDFGPFFLPEAGIYQMTLDFPNDNTGAYSFRLVDLATTPTLAIGQTLAVFTVSLTAASATPVTVQFATTDVTAQARSDYQPATGTLTFAPGITTRTIAVPVIRDTLVEPNETFQVNLSNATGDTIGDGQGIGTIISDDGVPLTLVVVNFTATPSGFTAIFNRDLDVNTLNLYNTLTGGVGPADVTLTSPGGLVSGSLTVDADLRRITFIKTGTELAPGSYSVVFRSAASGFRDTSGGLLDGNSDGATGDNYTNSFTVSSSPTVFVRLPDFARGPGQPVDVPATSTSNDLPLRLSESAGVTSVSLELRYNPALLSITAAAVASGLPAGATVTLTTPQPGVALINFTTPALATGVSEFVRLTAAVPDTAGYTAKHVLDLRNVVINGGSVAALDDDAIHAVGYFGDTTASGRATSLDAARIARVVVGLADGYEQWRLLDPVVISDITGNGFLSGQDATRVQQESVGLDRPEIPPLPGVLPPIVIVGPDPLLNIPRHFRARRGGLVTVPVNLNPSEGLESADLALSFDPQQLEVVSVRRGKLTRDFDLFLTNVDGEAGTLRVGLARTKGAISRRGAGSILLLTFRIKSNAPAGRAIINLRQNVSETFTELNEGGLDLIPDPSNEAGDRLDGAITILPNRTVKPVPALTATDVVFAELAQKSAKRRR